MRAARASVQSVAAQIGLSFFVLVGAGLFVRTLHNLKSLNVGFATDHLVTFGVQPTLAGYQPYQAGGLYTQVLRTLAGLPGVDSVAQTGVTPLSDSHRSTAFTVPGVGPRQAEINSVSAEYFSILGIPVVRGRNFTEAETRTGAAVTIATEHSQCYISHSLPH